MALDMVHTGHEQSMMYRAVLASHTRRPLPITAAAAASSSASFSYLCPSVGLRQMEKVHPWCGQPSDRGRLKNRTDVSVMSWKITIHHTHTPTYTHTHTHTFNGPFSGTTRVSRYKKGKTNLDFTEARDIEWQWHQLGHMQVCTSLQTDSHASTPPLSFYSFFSPSCRPTNSVKALKEKWPDATSRILV